MAAQRSSEFKWSSKTGQKHLSWSYMYTTEAVSRHVGVCGVRCIPMCAHVWRACAPPAHLPTPPPYPHPLHNGPQSPLPTVLNNIP